MFNSSFPIPFHIYVLHYTHNIYLRYIYFYYIYIYIYIYVCVCVCATVQFSL